MLTAVVGILFEIGKKVIDLHESGADKPILDAIHDIVHKAHSEVHEHHQRHHKSKKKFTNAINRASATFTDAEN